MQARKFRYYLKLFDGRLLYGDGTDVAEACRSARVRLAQVRRHMPIKAILTDEERKQRAAKFDALRKRAAQ